MDPTGGMQTFIVSLKSIGTDEDEEVDDIISGLGSMKVLFPPLPAILHI